mmetsp:Transcript_15677/g.38644  ORF Transcript_15677/g.38644 Transcript_15677/m.38644 type:complete len:177 (-) Transcript_15677:236-766(-)
MVSEAQMEPDAPDAGAMRQLVDQYIRASAGKPEGFLEAVEAFVAAVDWSERWLQTLFGCYLLMGVIIFFTRKNSTMQSFLLLSCLVGTLCAQYINDWGAEHWREFATQPYFDKDGFFISTVFSGPLLFFSMLILINMLYIMSDLLIKVKRKEFAREKRRKKKSRGSNNTARKPKSE